MRSSTWAAVLSILLVNWANCSTEEYNVNVVFESPPDDTIIVSNGECLDPSVQRSRRSAVITPTEAAAPSDPETETAESIVDGPNVNETTTSISPAIVPTGDSSIETGGVASEASTVAPEDATTSNAPGTTQPQASPAEPNGKSTENHKTEYNSAGEISVSTASSTDRNSGFSVTVSSTSPDGQPSTTLSTTFALEPSSSRGADLALDSSLTMTTNSLDYNATGSPPISGDTETEPDDHQNITSSTTTDFPDDSQNIDATALDPNSDINTSISETTPPNNTASTVAPASTGPFEYRCKPSVAKLYPRQDSLKEVCHYKGVLDAGNVCKCKFGSFGDDCQLGCNDETENPKCYSTEAAMSKIFCGKSIGCYCYPGYVGSSCAVDEERIPRDLTYRTMFNGTTSISISLGSDSGSFLPEQYKEFQFFIPTKDQPCLKDEAEGKICLKSMTDDQKFCDHGGWFDHLTPDTEYTVSVEGLCILYKDMYENPQRIPYTSFNLKKTVSTVIKPPPTVPKPSFERKDTQLTISFDKPDESQGKISCYLVVVVKLLPSETLDEIQTNLLNMKRYIPITPELVGMGGAEDKLTKLEPYVVLALDASGLEGDRLTLTLDDGSYSSCGMCRNVSNLLPQYENYMLTVDALVIPSTAPVFENTCGHVDGFATRSTFERFSYINSTQDESSTNMWIPIAVLTVILFLSLFVLSLLYFTRNRTCESLQMVQKFRTEETLNGDVGRRTSSALPMGQISSRHSPGSVALNGAAGGGGPGLNNGQLQGAMAAAKMNADNEFRNALIKEYGPEYLEDRRKCNMQITRANIKDVVKRKCSTPHFYYTFYRSRGIQPPGIVPPDGEPKYHDLTQWDFEFERIAWNGCMDDETPPSQVMNDPTIMEKVNKFSDVCPYNFNRVKLSADVESYPNGDKTNGSLIEFESLPTRFVAIQGPDQPHYIKHFWQIVYEYNCPAIVMLATFAMPGGKDGVQYWPEADDPDGPTHVYGNYTVTLTHKTAMFSYMDHRVFQVTYNPPPAADEDGETGPAAAAEPGETKVVHHFHYTMWNDYGIPTDTSSFWNFLDTATSFCEPDDTNPIVVHCRAGIGRTGTFIACHYLRQLLDRDGVVDVHRFVWQMRAQRKKSVQKVCQYRFIHQALLEHVLFSPCKLQSKQLPAFFQSNRSAIREELSNIEFCEKYREHHLEKEKGDHGGGGGGGFSSRNGGEDMPFPRDFQKIPYKYNFVKFPADIVHEVYSSYLNASWVCGAEDEPRTFLVTDLPYEVKHRTFWWMAVQHRVSYMVLLGEVPADEKPYWPDVIGQQRRYGRVNVTLADKTFPMQDNTPGGAPTAIFRTFTLSVIEDDDQLRKGDEWHVVHAQYLLLDPTPPGAPPRDAAHFAHFTVLLHQLMLRRSADQALCNCTIRNRSHSVIEPVPTPAPDIPASTPCDCRRPLLVQCLTGGLPSGLFCAIWMLREVHERKKLLNVPLAVHRLLEQRFTILPYSQSDLGCYLFIYESLVHLIKGTYLEYDESRWVQSSDSLYENLGVAAAAAAGSGEPDESSALLPSKPFATSNGNSAIEAASPQDEDKEEAEMKFFTFGRSAANQSNSKKQSPELLV